MSKTLTISDESYELIKEQLKDVEKTDLKDLNDLIGRKWFIRTVTYHMTGRIIKILGNMLLLEDASWIADSGRFTQAIKEGKLQEVEPVGEALINLDTIVDMFPWNHNLPREQI
jgi:hypothetical protein